MTVSFLSFFSSFYLFIVFSSSSLLLFFSSFLSSFSSSFVSSSFSCVLFFSFSFSSPFLPSPLLLSLLSPLFFFSLFLSLLLSPLFFFSLFLSPLLFFLLLFFCLFFFLLCSFFLFFFLLYFSSFSSSFVSSSFSSVLFFSFSFSSTFLPSPRYAIQLSLPHIFFFFLLLHSHQIYLFFIIWYNSISCLIRLPGPVLWPLCYQSNHQHHFLKLQRQISWFQWLLPARLNADSEFSIVIFIFVFCFFVFSICSYPPSQSNINK